MEHKVLIVDDDRDLVSVLSLYIKRKGFSTVGLFTIQEALGYIEGQKPDIIFLDNRLEDGLGIDIVKTIKMRYPSTKVILMTADELSDLKSLEGFSSFDDHLSKPFRIDKINSILQKIAA